MKNYVIEKVIKVVNDNRGVTALEYAVIAAAIIVAVTAAMAAYGPALTAKFSALIPA